MVCGTGGLVLFGCSLVGEFVLDLRDVVEHGHVMRGPGALLIPGTVALVAGYIAGIALQ
jgi:hypothetical protein